jgi:L-lysine exporter family protein LysE/ArgO
MLLGSFGSQFAEEPQTRLRGGAMLASLVWFYGLAFGRRLLPLACPGPGAASH